MCRLAPAVASPYHSRPLMEPVAAHRRGTIVGRRCARVLARPPSEHMNIRARLKSHPGSHRAWVDTEGNTRSIDVPGREGAPGSAVNGGEMLFLALATCYCNDVYREARTAGLEIRSLEVEVQGLFGRRGEPAREIRYSVRASSPDDATEVASLLRMTDTVAEVQNTLRLGLPVELISVEVVDG